MQNRYTCIYIFSKWLNNREQRMIYTLGQSDKYMCQQTMQKLLIECNCNNWRIVICLWRCKTSYVICSYKMKTWYTFRGIFNEWFVWYVILSCCMHFYCTFLMYRVQCFSHQMRLWQNAVQRHSSFLTERTPCCAGSKLISIQVHSCYAKPFYVIPV